MTASHHDASVSINAAIERLVRNSRRPAIVGMLQLGVFALMAVVAAALAVYVAMTQGISAALHAGLQCCCCCFRPCCCGGCCVDDGITFTTRGNAVDR